MLKIISFINIFKLAFCALFSLIILPFNKSRSLYLFFSISGPTFIKLGQLLATRPDLVGSNIASRLESFHDKVPPFSCRKAHIIFKKEFKKDYKDLFLEFSSKPIASASIAQVYKCKTLDGDDVAVKILRPNIIRAVLRDIGTLKIIVGFISLFSKYLGNKIGDIVEVLEFCSNHELNLLNEAAAASKLKENLLDFKGVYVPKVYWELTSKRVLTTKWVDGIALSDRDKINNSKINKIKACENLVIGYFNQVYRDGFFHADMHPGNLFLMKDSRIAVVDFGIIGIINKKTRIAIAEILINFLKKDYLKIAKIHIEAGLVPGETNIDEFALNCRIIGETIVGKSVSNTSFADLLKKLLQMTKRYNIKTRPELLLLQKTIMLVEGVGVSLNKDLNIWSLSKPWVKNWANENMGVDIQIRDHSIEFIDKLRNMAGLMESNLLAASQDRYLVEEIKSAKSRESSWKFFSLIFLSLLVISILSRYNIF